MAKGKFKEKTGNKGMSDIKCDVSSSSRNGRRAQLRLLFILNSLECAGLLTPWKISTFLSTTKNLSPFFVSTIFRTKITLTFISLRSGINHDRKSGCLKLNESTGMVGIETKNS